MSTESLIVPAGWGERFRSTLDIDEAFDALEGHRHFVSDSLRGSLRLIQLRPKESLELFDRALAKYREIATPDADDQRNLAMLLAGRFEACVVLEAQHDSEIARVRTDRAIDEFAEMAPTDNVVANRILEKMIGQHHLVRQRYQEALNVFSNVIAEHRNDARRVALAYTSAAAACFELGRFKDARRHYENADLCMAFNDDRLAFCVHVAWMMALTRHWKWEGEANRWRETLDALNCPDTFRGYLKARSELAYQSSARRRTFAFA